MYSSYMVKALSNIEEIECLKINAELNTSSDNIGKYSISKLFKFLTIIFKVYKKSKNSNLILNLHLA